MLVSKHSLKYQENLYLLIAIFTLRTQQSSLITSESSEVYAILELLQQVQDVSGSFKHHLFHLLPHEIAIDELLHFNF
ncbi:hypothetical protein SNF32_08980 [Enterococcus mundtii]|nr:hypothetical protein [Enterococcus mundtii]